MGFFSGILDSVGDVLGGVGDAVSGVWDAAKEYAAPIASALSGDWGSAIASFAGSFLSGNSSGDSFASSLGKWVGDASKGLLPGALTQYGAEQANEKNIELAREQMAFQDSQASRAMAFTAEEAAKQRQWSNDLYGSNRWFGEMMANSSYQRAVRDLKAAGLNPMLAYQQGGSQTPNVGVPSGAMGSGFAGQGTKAVVNNALGAGIQSALTASQVMQQLKNMAIQNDNLVKSGQRIDAETALIRAQTGVQTVLGPKIEQDTRTSVASAAQLDARTKETLFRLERILPSEAAKVFQEAWNLKYSEEEIKSRIKLLESRNVVSKLEATQMELMIPLLRNLAGAQSSWWMQNVSPYLNDLSKITNSAGMVRGFMR